VKHTECRVSSAHGTRHTTPEGLKSHDSTDFHRRGQRQASSAVHRNHNDCIGHLLDSSRAAGSYAHCLLTAGPVYHLPHQCAAHDPCTDDYRTPIRKYFLAFESRVADCRVSVFYSKLVGAFPTACCLVPALDWHLAHCTRLSVFDLTAQSTSWIFER